MLQDSVVSLMKLVMITVMNYYAKDEVLSHIVLSHVRAKGSFAVDTDCNRKV